VIAWKWDILTNLDCVGLKKKEEEEEEEEERKVGLCGRNIL